MIVGRLFCWQPKQFYTFADSQNNKSILHWNLVSLKSVVFARLFLRGYTYAAVQYQNVFFLKYNRQEGFGKEEKGVTLW